MTGRSRSGDGGEAALRAEHPGRDGQPLRLTRLVVVVHVLDRADLVALGVVDVAPDPGVVAVVHGCSLCYRSAGQAPTAPARGHTRRGRPLESPGRGAFRSPGGEVTSAGRRD